ncbi:MAG: hypothetical protein RML12_11165 [Xanthomonadales bacterium]|nr:hypothetical protein [Xanthomonadales bacterium]
MLRFAHRPALALFLAALGCAELHAADTVIVNGGFDRDFAGWQNRLSRIATWQAENATGGTGSGSVRLTHDGDGNNAFRIVLSQCIPSVGGRPYQLSFRGRIPAGQPAGTAAGVFLFSYAQPNCAGSGTLLASPNTESASWTLLSASATTPAGAQSISIELGARKASGVPASTLASADFDDVRLGTPDAGFAIRSQHSGAWYNPAWPGQGFFLDVAPAIDTLFAGWFAWTSTPGEYVWLTAQGGIHGDTAHVPLYQTTGGLLLDPRPVSNTVVGTAAFRFTSCTSGLVQIFWQGRPMATFPIERLTPPPAGC